MIPIRLNDDLVYNYLPAVPRMGEQIEDELIVMVHWKWGCEVWPDNTSHSGGWYAHVETRC